jgi:hypothetical protein
MFRIYIECQPGGFSDLYKSAIAPRFNLFGFDPNNCTHWSEHVTTIHMACFVRSSSATKQTNNKCLWEWWENFAFGDLKHQPEMVLLIYVWHTHTRMYIYICVCVRDTCVWVYRYVQSTYTYAYNGVWMYPSQRTMLCRGDKRPDLAGFSPVLCCQSWQRPHVAERACEKYLNASSDQTGLSRLRKLKVWHVSVSARHPKTQSESRLNLPTLCQSENWNQHQIEQRLPKSQEVGMGT